MLLTIDQAGVWSIWSGAICLYVYRRFSARYPLRLLRVGSVFAVPFLIMLFFDPNESMPKALGIVLVVGLAALFVGVIAAAVVAILKRHLLLAATLGAIAMMYAMASMGWLDRTVSVGSFEIRYASFLLLVLALSIEYFVKRLEHSRRDLPKSD